MSYFNNWKSTLVNQMSNDSTRVPYERKRENKTHIDLPEDHQSPYGPSLHSLEGVQSPGSKAKEMEEDEAVEEGPFIGKTEPRKEVRDWKLPIPLGPVTPPLISSGPSDTKTMGRGCELSPPTAKSFRIYDARMACLPQQGPFRHLLDMKAEKRLAGWKERRSRFGDINTHKCYRFGQIFSPFQALATTEMQRLVLPRNLPMSSRMQNISASFPSNMNLQDLPLSPTELGLGQDDNHHEREKPVSHIKPPLFPPIVKATKYNDMK